jgi:hypothetical protein
LARLVNVSAGKRTPAHFLGKETRVVAGFPSLLLATCPRRVKSQTGTSGYSLQQHWSLKKYELFWIWKFRL